MRTRSEKTRRAVLRLACVTVAALFCGHAMAQLDQNCVVSVLNRNAQVNPNGSWTLVNVPANFGRVRARATCVENGVTRSGQSDFFSVPANGIVGPVKIILGTFAPVPASLTVTSTSNILNTVGATAQLKVMSTFADGTAKDLTLGSAGTNYTVGSAAVATVTPDGLVTAQSSGTALISAMNEGALGVIAIQVVLGGSSRGDGIPDSWLIANHLNPNDPVVAQEDPDGDGLTNLQEFQHGTDPNNPSTSGDGIPDGLAVQLGFDPLNPNLLLQILPKALKSISVTPSNFIVNFTTILGEASTQLKVTGTLVDLKGTQIDLTSTSKGTNYRSSDLTICNFGSPDGRVFAGNSGPCTITVTNNGLSSAASGVVRTFVPTPLSFISIPGFANNVGVSGNFAYVAAGSAGLQVVDVTDRTAPKIAASLALSGNANDIKVVGTRAYIAGGSAGLQIIDITNPLAPALLGSVGTPDIAWDVAISGNLVFVADGAQGLQIVESTNPAAPTIAGSVAIPGTAKGVAVTGNLALVAAGAGGLQVVDVTNAVSPKIVGSAAIPGDARDVVVKDSTAYVAAFTGSLEIVDFSSPSSPAIVGSTPSTLGGYLQDVALFTVLGETFAFGADVFFVNGVPITDVTTPNNPISRTLLDFSKCTGCRDDNGTGIAVDSNYVYLTDQRGISENGATEDTRLYIGQYLPLEDTRGVPPTVSITSPAAGTTFIEGQTIAVIIAASDDVAVAAVNLLENGQVVATATTPPYRFTFTVPVGVTGVTLGATAVDLGPLTTTAQDVQLNVIPDPLTTVAGTAVNRSGNPIAGATVAVFGHTGLTAADGTFSISSVPTILGNLQVGATFTAPDGSKLTGASGSFAPVRGGTTNVGTITLQPAVVVVQTFDPAASFSLASNPNGPWTYGATHTLGSITPFTMPAVSGVLNYWHIAPGISESAGAPVVSFNAGTTTFTSLAIVLRPGQLAFHPGPDSFAVIRWTAPVSGQFDVKALFTGGDIGSTQVFVLHGPTTLFCGGLSGNGDAQPFERTLSLSAGETIDFAVGPVSFVFDTTLINATISQTTGAVTNALLQDNFNCENGRVGTLNYTGFANWNVTRGSVDLFGNGFNDFIPQNGLYVGLDGSSNLTGRLESKTSFTLDPGTYELQFDLAGSQRGNTNTMTVGLGTVYNESFTLNSPDPLRTIVRDIPVITATAGGLSFDNSGGNSSGLLLDNVLLRKVTCTLRAAGLVGWWPGDGNANDLAGTNAGTLQNGATFAPGMVSQAFSLNGTNQLIQVPDSNLWAFGSNDFTIDLWVNFNVVPQGSLGQPGAVFIGNDEGTGNVNKWFFALGGGVLNFHINGPSIGPIFLAQTEFSPKPHRWYHMAVVRQSNTYTIYINGIPTTPETNATVIPNPNAPLTLGQAEGVGFVNGLLDEIEIYNRALSTQEIQAIFNAGSAGKCK